MIQGILRMKGTRRIQDIRRNQRRNQGIPFQDTVLHCL